MCRNVVTEMSRDWNGPDRNGLTETARPNRPDRIRQIEKSRTRPPSRYSLQNAIKFDKVIVLFTVKKHFERYHCMNSASKILRYTFSLCFFILCVCLWVHLLYVCHLFGKAKLVASWTVIHYSKKLFHFVWLPDQVSKNRQFYWYCVTF